MKKNPQTLYEVLETINKDVTLLGGYFKSNNPNTPLAQVFRAAFLSQMKWALPEGEPPYKPSQYTEGATPIDLQIAIRRGRFDYFSPKMKIEPKNRERIFIQLLEGVHANEAKVLIAIKDQCLTEMFPNITYDVLAEYGYLPKREKPAEKKEQTPKQVVDTKGEGEGEATKADPTPDSKSDGATPAGTTEDKKPVAKKPVRRRSKAKTTAETETPES